MSDNYMRNSPGVDVDTLLSNAACASQNKSLLDCAATRGAVLRSFAQWINHNVVEAAPIMDRLKEHPDYDS